MATKRRREPESEPVRRGTRSSTRKAKRPARFRPGSNLGEELSTMVSDVATEVATKSTFKFDADALGALEDEHAIALEEVLPRVFDLAFDHARKNKRSEINAADIAFVQKAFKTK